MWVAHEIRQHSTQCRNTQNMFSLSFLLFFLFFLLFFFFFCFFFVFSLFVLFFLCFFFVFFFVFSSFVSSFFLCVFLRCFFVLSSLCSSCVLRVFLVFLCFSLFFIRGAETPPEEMGTEVPDWWSDVGNRADRDNRGRFILMLQPLVVGREGVKNPMFQKVLSLVSSDTPTIKTSA